MRKTSATTLAVLALAAPAGAQAKNPTPKGGGHTPVTICHHAGPTKVITITVDDDGQVQGHLRHGDTIGACAPVTPPPTPTPDPDPQPTPDPDPTPPVTEQPAVTPPGVTNPDYTPAPPKAEADKPAQVVAPDKAAGKPTKHERTVARVHRQQAALEQRVAAARAQPELPRTGFPAGLVLLAGLACAGLGLVLRSKSTLT